MNTGATWRFPNCVMGGSPEPSPVLSLRSSLLFLGVDMNKVGILCDDV